MHAGDLTKLKDAFNRWIARHRAPPLADALPPNEVAEALKKALGLKPLDPKLEAKLRNARLRPSRDGKSLLMDWK